MAAALAPKLGLHSCASHSGHVCVRVCVSPLHFVVVVRCSVAVWLAVAFCWALPAWRGSSNFGICSALLRVVKIMIYVCTYVRLSLSLHIYIWLDDEDDDSGSHYVSQQECGKRLPQTIFQLPRRCGSLCASTIFTHTYTHRHTLAHTGTHTHTHRHTQWPHNRFMAVRVAFLSCCVVSFFLIFVVVVFLLHTILWFVWAHLFGPPVKSLWVSGAWDLGPGLLLNCSCLC